MCTIQMKKVILVFGGELAYDVAQQLLAKKPSNLFAVDVSLRNASERPKTLLENGEDTIICFIIQTIENANPTEEVSSEIVSFGVYETNMMP